MIGEEEAMSVLCHEMVASKASGIIQSVHLRNGVPDSLAVYAAFGLGRTVVEGKGPGRPVCHRTKSAQPNHLEGNCPKRVSNNSSRRRRGKGKRGRRGEPDSAGDLG